MNGSATTNSRLLEAARADVAVGQVVDRPQAAAARAVDARAPRSGSSPSEPCSCGSRRCSARVATAEAADRVAPAPRIRCHRRRRGRRAAGGGAVAVMGQPIRQWSDSW